MTAKLPLRKTAHQREERRIRIMGQVRAGFSYEAIARDENLSRERIRQIVTQSLQTERGADRIDHNRLQIARLEPALRLAARGIESGKLPAIGHLLKVLERLDKYGSVVQIVDNDAQGVRERLMRKLGLAVAKIRRDATPAGAPSGEPEETESLEEKKTGWADL